MMRLVFYHCATDKNSSYWGSTTVQRTATVVKSLTRFVPVVITLKNNLMSHSLKSLFLPLFFNVMTTGMNLVRLLTTVAVLCTVVEHPPHHSKVEGSSLAAGRQKITKNCNFSE